VYGSIVAKPKPPNEGQKDSTLQEVIIHDVFQNDIQGGKPLNKSKEDL